MKNNGLYSCLHTHLPSCFRNTFGLCSCLLAWSCHNNRIQGDWNFGVFLCSFVTCAGFCRHLQDLWRTSKADPPNRPVHYIRYLPAVWLHGPVVWPQLSGVSWIWWNLDHSSFSLSFLRYCFRWLDWYGCRTLHPNIYHVSRMPCMPSLAKLIFTLCCKIETGEVLFKIALKRSRPLIDLSTGSRQNNLSQVFSPVWNVLYITHFQTLM